MYLDVCGLSVKDSGIVAIVAWYDLKASIINIFVGTITTCM